MRNANLRFFNICGANPKHKIGPINNSGFVKILCHAGHHKKNIFINGNNFSTNDGYAVRDYLHIDDLNLIIFKSIFYLKKNKKNLLINCGSGKGVSTKQLFDYYQNYSKNKINIKILKRINEDPDEVVANTKNLFEKLNFLPRKSSVKNIIDTSIKWEKILTKL